MPTRRSTLRSLAALGLSGILPARAQTPSAAGSPAPLRLGLISDIHKDIIHDADKRLDAFIGEMEAKKVDAIFQLGDFCIPKPANADFLRRFNGFESHHHVIGNHDTDGGFSREKVVEFYGMPSRFYSFDLRGVHLIVLDANDRPADHKSGYPSFIAPDQVEWLRDDLARTSLPTLVFSHQSLERPACIRNQEEVRKVLSSSLLPSGKPKVLACLNGHWHIDHQRVIDGIPYLHINSAAYFWLGDAYRRERLDPETARRFPYVSRTAPYQESLFAVLEVEPSNRRLKLTGRTSTWLGPSPQELDYKSEAIPAESVFPGIRDRKV